ncbi:TPA: geranylgeranyl reductase family protein [Candidatus Micrarchaeota archaeon]|nr:geranylgeranyl reductase family protein [Candidatus Micrarchaeota archaeon]
MEQPSFDVIIVGGGPGGSTCATFLGQMGHKVLLLDKAKFPRDKTCGDAISGKSMGVLREMGLLQGVEGIETEKIYGVTFSSPEGYVVEIPFRTDENVGYCARRLVYDNFLFQRSKQFATVMEEFMVTDLIKECDYVVGIKGKSLKENTELEFRAKVVVGADGATSVVANKLGMDKIDENHHCVAVRAYYKGVTGMNRNIELHFVDSIIPGYFWIFPLDNGLANVGVGLLTKDFKKKKINLKEWMLNEIKVNPLFKDRFANAEQVSEVKAWNLPFGSKRRKNHGNGFVLIGDAASLIDPFTGEGIGNAMLSGKLAANAIHEAFAKSDFSERALASYEKTLHEEIDHELVNSYRMQRLGSIKPVLNWIVRKAAKNQHAKDLIASTLSNETARKEFTSPLLYLKILLS